MLQGGRGATIRPMLPPPTLERTRAALAALGDRIDRTPTRPWIQDLRSEGGEGPRLFLKLELFQRTGTFKVRGALTNMLAAPPDALARGVTAVSAGNHAIAVAWAARELGTSARVVMLRSANPARVSRCRGYGAEIELAPDGAAGFERVRQIEREEGRIFIHPFEGEHTILGTSTLGLELVEQEAGLEAVVVPVGGGGLIAGVSAAIKASCPDCAVYGVEPEGADTMRRSLEAGSPVALSSIQTIADSLGAPHAAPYGFSIVQRCVDRVITVDDGQICEAMWILFADAKLAVEPASAAPLAALRGPLAETLRGKRVALIISGSNIDRGTFAEHVSRGDTSTRVEESI